MNKYFENIHGKLVFSGNIKLLSASLIGSGSNEKTDIDLLLDHEEKPFIPATSFVGSIREYLRNSKNTDLDKLFGNNSRSIIKCADLKVKDAFNTSISIRDGIRVDNKTGMVEKGAKYDYEVIEHGAVFKLRMEADYSKENKEQIIDLFSLLKQVLKQNYIKIGARTNSGLGSITIENEYLEDYDFSNSKDVCNWLIRKSSNRKIELPQIDIQPTYNFYLDINLNLRNSLLVRSYPSDPKLPDAVHISSNGKPILPGSSIKGAIRARAERIINTLNSNLTYDIISNLFGSVDTTNKNSKAYKGRIIVEEKILPKFIAEVQSRIKIDRFTGGTVNTALFDSMPLFNETIDTKDDTIKISIQIKKCSDLEAGLMLLILKDLWTGDLAVGGEKNIGRGVFDGTSATMYYNGELLNIDSDIADLSQDSKNKMQQLVDSLIQKLGVENESK